MIELKLGIRKYGYHGNPRKSGVDEKSTRGGTQLVLSRWKKGRKNLYIPLPRAGIVIDGTA